MDDHGFTFMVAMLTVVLIVVLGIIIDGAIYRNTDYLYCDCIITGKVDDADSNAVSFSCDRGVNEIVRGISNLEYQALSVGQKVVVTARRTRAMDDTVYSIRLSDSRCP